MENTQQFFCRQRHILLLRDDSEIFDDHLRCEICSYSVKTPYYVCNSCKYYVHKSCAELPKQINLSFHPGHPLTLLRRSTTCDSCQQYFKNSLIFRCVKCKLDLDVECAMMSNSTTACPKGQEHCSIQHSSHPHLLLLVNPEINEDMEIECFACKSKSSLGGDGVYYGCNRCKYYLHKQCIDQLPQEIQTPIHPHILSLRARMFNCRCNFCDKGDYGTLSFECLQCDFELCVQCGVNQLVTITFNDEGEEHLLYFVEKTYTQLDQCNAYDCYRKLYSVNSNSNEFDVTTSSIFRCVDCDFKLHLLCGPIPCTIKHERHIDPLNLVDSFIEDYTGEYYCDVCETNRNPRIRVYCCDQCKYIAHVHCVVPEIVNVLKDDIRDVKFKSLAEDLWTLQDKEQNRSLLTLKDLISKLTADELSMLRSHFYWDEDNNREQEVSQRTSQLEPGDETIDEVLEFSSFTEDGFSDFIEHVLDDGRFFKENRKLKINSSDLVLKIVKVEGYWIPFTLATVLKNLLHKYGDISRKSGYSLEMKSIMYFFLCQVMKKMHTTLVIDITKYIRDWYYYVRFTHYNTAFDVNFLKVYLKEITRAYFYLQLRKLDVEVPTILQNEIANYEAKIAKSKAKLETCTNLRESSRQQEFMKKGLNKLMKLNWKTASEVHF